MTRLQRTAGDGRDMSSTSSDHVLKNPAFTVHEVSDLEGWGVAGHPGSTMVSGGTPL